MFKVLFVCMGNICRSPSAEGFFRHHLTASAGSPAIETDSAGTHRYHIGHPPDSRAIAHAAEFGVDISDLRARQVRPSDFDDFDLILAMDRDNLALLEAQRPPGCRAELRLMQDFEPDSAYREVPDPYYGGAEDFKLMCSLLDSSTQSLLHAIKPRTGS